MLQKHPEPSWFWMKRRHCSVNEAAIKEGSGLSTGVAYILTRFDSYSGILVATTNRIEDLDEAFFRRFDDYAVLPIPDAPTRQSLWRKIMGEHAGVDYDLLGNNFAISGGLIKGAAIRARAWAYGLDKPVTTPFALAALVRPN